MVDVSVYFANEPVTDLGLRDKILRDKIDKLANTGPTT
jgi:hypothetical protein